MSGVLINVVTFTLQSRMCAVLHNNISTDQVQKLRPVRLANNRSYCQQLATKWLLEQRQSRDTLPTIWNSLPDFIRHPTTSADSYRRLLKTYLFARYWCIQRVRGS